MVGSVEVATKVVLELTVEELNTLFCAAGGVNPSRMEEIARKYNLKTVPIGHGYMNGFDKLYSDLKALAVPK